MKNLTQKLALGSLTSLAVISSAAFAQEIATAPSLEGGITASIGALYVVPSADNTEYAITNENGSRTEHIKTADPGYDFGWQASLGYLFEDTANGIELFYRGINTDGDTNTTTLFSDTEETETVSDKVSYELNAADLMISQFLDIGTHMQMRFQGGLAYVELEQEQEIKDVDTFTGETPDISLLKQKNEFRGWGPRLAIDARYDFGEEIAGFGIVGGASVAYFLGETELTATRSLNGIEENRATEDINNHAVTNLRGNLGIDYVYFFDDEESTLGIELGYLVDFYDDAITTFGGIAGTSIKEPMAENIDAAVATVQRGSSNSPVTFSGPYLNLKAVF